MITLEKVEKLREYAGITYAEAKAALEESDGDLLEAVVKLEEEGKIESPKEGGYYKSKAEKESRQKNQDNNYKEEADEEDHTPSLAERLGNILKWFGKIIDKGNKNNFKVMKNDTKILEIPLTAFALLLLFAFWGVIPILVIGLLFGYRYSLSGPDLGKSSVNKTISTVSDATINAVDSMSEKASKFAQDAKKDKGEKNNGENTNN
ncbi:MAG: DUF4342 domain-containing protein [Bacillota bacterium]